MIERGEHLGFALEAPEPIVVGGKDLRQHFDGDLATKFGVAGAIDLAHAARTEQGDNLKGAEERAGRQRHYWLSARIIRQS